MSPPTLLKNPNFNDKKTMKGNQTRNYSCSNATRNSRGGQVVNDLLSELQDVLCDNAKYQSENSNLKFEIADLREKNDNLIDAIHASKVEFEKDLNRLQDDIQKNESHLINNSKKCLQQQKMHLLEIEQLKSENEHLKLEIAKHETDTTEKTKTLESEIKLLQLSYNTAQTQNEENALKSSKYKNKLKYAITIINDLNNMLVQHTTKPDFFTRETQTVDELSQSSQDLSSSHSFTVSQPRNLQTENLILSDIFFKSKAFCDTELLLFNKNDSSHTFDFV